MLKHKAPEDFKEAMKQLPTKPFLEFPSTYDWLNTRDRVKLSFSEHLRGKFVIIDFWTSCCINCIHMLAELARLEKLFSEIPEVVFLGCHSAKFSAETSLSML